MWNAFDGHYHCYDLATFLMKRFMYDEEVFAIKLQRKAWFFLERKLMISVIKLGISWNGKRRLRGAFHFRPELPHFPSKSSSSSRIVPKKVVVVVESIDFTWSYLSLSYTTTTATASPNFSLLLLKQEFLQLKTKGSSGPIFRTKSQQPCFPILFWAFRSNMDDN